MSEGLILFVHDLPLLFEGRDELLSLLVVHEEFLSVLFVLLLNLHFSNKPVLVIDFALDLLQILWHLSEILFLEVVFIFVFWKSWGGQDVFNSVGNNEVLVTHEAHNWFVLLLWDWSLLGYVSVELLGYIHKHDQLSINAP